MKISNQLTTTFQIFRKFSNNSVRIHDFKSIKTNMKTFFNFKSFLFPLLHK